MPTKKKVLNILLLGNGAREHALAEAIKRSKHSVKLFAYMKSKNPGIAKLADGYVLVKYTDFDEIKSYCTLSQIDFAVIGPENSLELGIVDALEEIDVKSVGPKKILAQLETSKSFTRNLLTKYKIPGNPIFKVFPTKNGLYDFIKALNGNKNECKNSNGSGDGGDSSSYGFVIKADGLQGGKGVKVSGDHLKSVQEGVEYAEECIINDGRVVVEEKFIGQEFSLMCFCDGKTVVGMPAVQDHKRAFELDQGPNTGGMGSYSDKNHLLPFLTQKDYDDALSITQKVCDALKKETNLEYKGIMYGGFIAVKDGVRLIEYNARFGDPEAMNVLAILKTDFVDVCLAIINGGLNNLTLEFDNKATVCKYVVPEGYPDNPVTNISDEKLTVNEKKIHLLGARAYYASVDERKDETGKKDTDKKEISSLYMTSSRAVGVLGIANTISDAEKIAEQAVACISGRVFHRKDIGTQELVEKRVKHMKEIRKA